ncbi:MAG TPA: sigma-70 family RNA polymerase sigma factor [Actinomycetota bacterium]|nr:sigma-70 family RNA polymerase sigma factor [Actinomycetota bacterium]
MDRTHDAALADRLMARDEEALGEVIAVHGGVIYGVARRVVADPTLAEEVAQDTFLALWRRPGAFDPQRGSLQAWLAGIARNKSVDLVRREQSLRRTADVLASEAEAFGAPVERPERRVDERDEVRAALVQLTPVQREAVVLAYFGGRTYREVATELGIPEGTAKTRLRDGLVKLRDLISSARGDGR